VWGNDPAARWCSVMLPWIVLAMVVLFFLLQATGVLEQLRRTSAERKARPPTAPPKPVLQKPSEAVQKRLQVFEEFLENLSDDDSPKGKDPS
jgi:hypothetical protein